MDFSIDELIELSKNITFGKEIQLMDIPCVDLYMDQVTTLFEDRLYHLKREDSERILTKTMINNYAKAKIITPIKNKKYNKQQIIVLIFIYHLKQILSLDDISLLFNPLVKALNENKLQGEFVDTLYEKFLETKESQNICFTEDFKDAIEKIKESKNLEGDDREDLSKMLLTVLSLINSSLIQKRMAERIIDEYFKQKVK
jgi:hypothetical protein